MANLGARDGERHVVAEQWHGGGSGGQPELVVEDEPELLERVRRHPMLLWTAENGRKRRRPGRGGGWAVAKRRGR